jgi:hypothetical protein
LVKYRTVNKRSISGGKTEQNVLCCNSRYGPTTPAVLVKNFGAEREFTTVKMCSYVPLAQKVCITGAKCCIFYTVGLFFLYNNSIPNNFSLSLLAEDSKGSSLFLERKSAAGWGVTDWGITVTKELPVISKTTNSP